jgi:hypothetical protein
MFNAVRASGTYLKGGTLQGRKTLGGTPKNSLSNPTANERQWTLISKQQYYHQRVN